MNLYATKFKVRSTVAVCLGAVLLAGLGSISPAQARELPSADQAELKKAKKARFGQTVSIGVCEKGSLLTGCTKVGTLKVRIDRIRLNTESRDTGFPTFIVDMKAQNFSKIRTGLLPRIRCQNVAEPGGWSNGEVNTQVIPSRSQIEGTHIISMPSNDYFETVIEPTACKNAVLWFYPMNSLRGQKPPKGLVGEAYIPIPPRTLQQLQTEGQAWLVSQGLANNPE